MNKIFFAVLVGLMPIVSGCASPNQMFGGAELTAVSNDRGMIGNENASASYAVAAITSNGQSVDVVALKGENGFVVKACAVIPFDKVLEFMPRTVSEALALCTGVDAGLKLNVNTRTNDVVWLAKTDGSIHSLFMTLSKPGMILNTDVDLIVHFTFTDHRFVRVDQRQIIAWSRGQGTNVAPAPASPPAPVAPAPVLPDPRSLSQAPSTAPAPDGSIRRPDGLAAAPPPPAPTPAAPVQLAQAPAPPPVVAVRGPTPLPPPPVE